MSTSTIRGDPDFYNCGHPRTPENSFKNGVDGNPICKTCAKERRKLRPKKKKPLPEACARGHAYTPENTILTAHGNRNCRICWGLKIKAMRVEKPPKPQKIARTRCRVGHELTPDNLVTVNGRQTCRTCRNAYNRESLRLARLGLKRERQCATWGMSLEKKIEAWRQPPDANGCRLWTGPTAKGGRALVQVRKGEIQQRIAVHKKIWQDTSGEKLVDRIVRMTCVAGNACTTYEHMEAITWLQLVHTDEHRAATAQSNRIKRGTERERYLKPALPHIVSLRQMLYVKFGDRIGPHVEDVIQYVLIQLFLAWARNRKEIPNLRAWMMLTARYQAFNLLKNNKVYITSSLDEPVSEEDEGGATRKDFLAANEDSDPAILQEREEIEEGRRSILSSRLRRLPTQARQVFRLQHRHGMSTVDIAKRTELSLPTVRRYLWEGRRKILSIKKRGVK